MLARMLFDPVLRMLVKALAAQLFAWAVILHPAVGQTNIPVFAEETATAGVAHTYGGGFQYFVGGGVAAFDCDGDELPDLFLAGGENRSGLYRNVSAIGGALKFRQVVSSVLSLRGVTGAYPLDIDGDGLTDLAVLRTGRNILFRGLGDCRFSDANGAWGFDGGNQWTTAFAATWEEGAIWPTLAIGNYIDQTAPGAPFGTCAQNFLYRPRPNGGYGVPDALLPSHCALSMLFTRWRGIGAADLRVSNDRQYYRGGSEQLWRIDRAGLAAPYDAQDGWQDLKIWGMGIAAQDLDLDGYPEFFLTSMGDNKLRTLDREVLADPLAEPVALRPQYHDIALARGVTAHKPPGDTGGELSTGWHAQFNDVNNDGIIDLFVAKGNVSSMQGFAIDDPNNLFLGRADGTFSDVALPAGVASSGRGRGAAVVDLNSDGSLDLVVVNQGTPTQIWRNLARENADTANWLQVRFVQSGGNSGAIGARIELRRVGASRPFVSRDLTIGGGHASGSVGWTHFGLGSNIEVEVRINWPDGVRSDWIPLPARDFVILQRFENASNPTVQVLGDLP